MKVNELTGPALDWAVAKCETGHNYPPETITTWHPSNDWAQGGPIIERELMRVQPFMGKWIAYIDHTPAHADGPTPLIAAMRCYVASELGDEIEIPEELK